MKGLQGFKDSLSRGTYGMTKAEAHAKGVCVDCKQPVAGLLRTIAEEREYRISGICGLCWDKMFSYEEVEAATPDTPTGESSR